MTSHTSRYAVEVENVSKHIKGRCILDQVSLKIPAHHIYGISGHNGAGKSMLFRVIAGLVLPTHGRVRVFDQIVGEHVEFPQSTGAMIDGPGFLPHHSGLKNLQLLAMIRNEIGLDDIAAAMQSVGLNPRDTKPVRTYSTGMRQRLGLAQALMEKPQLLLLDEPTSAIDREGRQRIYQLLRDVQARGTTIVLTSHNSDELATLCDTIVHMENGHLVAPDSHAMGDRPA
jgi:ABC-2 type transport system ATP-binding protein